MIAGVKIDALIVCEKIYQEKNGKFILNLPLSDIVSSAFPLRPQLGIYFVGTGLAPKSAVHLFFGLEGGTLKEINKWNVPDNFDPKRPAEFAAEGAGMEFKVPGAYRLSLSVGGEEVFYKIVFAHAAKKMKQ